MGIGFLFKLDETSVQNHKNERKIKGQANQLINNEAGNTMLETDASNTDCSNKTEEGKVDNENVEKDPFDTDIKVEYKTGSIKVTTQHCLQ